MANLLTGFFRIGADRIALSQHNEVQVGALAPCACLEAG